jgi:hypothetical protein
MEYLKDLLMLVLWRVYPSYASRLLMNELTWNHVAEDSKYWT